MKLLHVIYALSSLVIVLGANTLAALFALELALRPLGTDITGASNEALVLGAIGAYALARLVASIVVAADDATRDR